MWSNARQLSNEHATLLRPGPGRVSPLVAGREIDGEVRELIRDMWRSNPTWGKLRIQAELRKIGIEVSDSTVWRHRAPQGGPPSQSWRPRLPKAD